jgi:hypothetical protein
MVEELQKRTVRKTPWLSSVKVYLHVGNIGADKRITLQLMAMVQIFGETLHHITIYKHRVMSARHVASLYSHNIKLYNNVSSLCTSIRCEAETELWLHLFFTLALKEDV